MNNHPQSCTSEMVVTPLSTLFDPEAAGRYIGGAEKPISPLTLADWRAKRFGPAYVRVGRLIRYRQADLDAWLETRVKKGV
jgi:hypothetical protein